MPIAFIFHLKFFIFIQTISMRNSLFSVFVALIASYVAQAQSPEKAKAILTQAVEKCQTIDEGSYLLEKRMKFMSKKDTSSISYETFFKTLPDDTILKLQVNSTISYPDYPNRLMIYTGQELVSASYQDSTAEIISLYQWPKVIDAYANNFELYTPFTHTRNHPLPGPASRSDSGKYQFAYLGEAEISGKSCAKIRMWKSEEIDTTEFMSVVWTECVYYINPLDSVPVAFEETLDVATRTDTSRQYRFLQLSSYNLSPVKKDLSIFRPYLPDYFNFKDYVPRNKPEPLPIDTLAPGWKLINLAGDSIALEDLRGKVVLIDFFYKSCYPCQKAMPALQKLHEKYHAQGLKIVGINPFDDKEEDDLVDFLSTRGVTYEVLLAPRELARKYRVNGYPTVYLISREGNISKVQSGYGDSTEEELEAEILKLL